MLRKPHLIAALALAFPIAAHAQGDPTTDEAPPVEAPVVAAEPAVTGEEGHEEALMKNMARFRSEPLRWVALSRQRARRTTP